MKHLAPQIYDVFLSFKNYDTLGNGTRDAQLAQEIHDFLKEKGLRVFFSSVSLERLGVAAYKQAIDNALESAEVLVAVGTSAENLNSEWVRYEWDSFENDVLSGLKPHGRVFSYIESVGVNELPRALRQNQAIIHKPGAKELLYNFISNTTALDQLTPAERHFI